MAYDFRVILDEDALIIEFEDPKNILGHGTSGEMVIGKNWFSEFIDTTDFAKVMAVFVEIFSGKAVHWQTYKNDVLTADHMHKLIDFYNHLIEKDGRTLLEFYGFEHFTNAIESFSPLNLEA